MAGEGELDSFVRKFKSLCKSGRDAKLHVKTEAGDTFVTLSVGLGQVPPGNKLHAVHPRGGAARQQKEREERQNVMQLRKLLMLLRM